MKILNLIKNLFSKKKDLETIVLKMLSLSKENLDYFDKNSVLLLSALIKKYGEKDLDKNISIEKVIELSKNKEYEDYFKEFNNDLNKPQKEAIFNNMQIKYYSSLSKV